MHQYRILAIVCTLLCAGPAMKAQVNTLYYMENIPARTNLNPAFIPVQKFYIDLPVISGIAFSVGNNALTAQDIVVKQGDELVSALQKGNDHTPFLNSLKTTTNLTSESRINLLGFGFKVSQGYFTFGISERYRMGANIPKSFANMLVYGDPDPLEEKSYNLKKIGCDITSYLEAAFGYARKIDENWMVGGKFKLLFGQAHADMSFDKLGMDVTDQTINFYGNGEARFTVPITVSQRNGLPYIQQSDVQLNSMLHPVGFGAALDAGAVYSYTENLSLSASLTDIGLMHWKKSSWRAKLKTSTTYQSWDFTVDNSSSGWSDQMSDSLKKAYDPVFNDPHGYITILTATARAGAEYKLLKNKMSLGLLLTKTFGGRYRYDEVLTSVNFRPLYWANASVSYGWINGNMSTLGLGLNLIAGPVNFFAVTDYLPFSYTDNGIPYKSKYVNGHVGISLTFMQGKPKQVCHCESIR